MAEESGASDVRAEVESAADKPKKRAPASSTHLPSPPPSNDGSSGVNSKRTSPVIPSSDPVSEPALEHGLYTPPRLFESPERKYRKVNNGARVITASNGASVIEEMLTSPIKFVPASELTANYDLRNHQKAEAQKAHSEEHRLRRQQTAELPTARSSGFARRPWGLNNPHNFCYRRSVLQSLLHLPMFYNWLRSRKEQHQFKKLHLPNQRCLVCDFSKLCDAAWSKDPHTPARLRELDQAISVSAQPSAHPWARNASQADAHEFLCWIVQQLSQRYNVPARALDGMFRVRVLSQWSCDDCCEIHTGGPQDETGLSVQIKTPNSGSLMDYIDTYFADTVEEARCENNQCKSKGNRRRRRMIDAAPEILFVHLARFESNYNAKKRTFTTNKLTKDVKIGQYLDLSRYSSNRHIAKSEASLLYKLSSVVKHSGSLKFGHYITFADGPAGPMRYDDTCVDRATMDEMMSGGDGFTPYILTYISCTGESSVAS